MSRMFLTKAQRELIKFQQSYTLSLKKPKKKLMNNQPEPDDDDKEVKFNPDEDEIDARLYR